MVPRHVREDLQLPAFEAGELAVRDQMVTVFVMTFEIDEVANIGHQRRRLDELLIFELQIEWPRELLPQ